MAEDGWAPTIPELIVTDYVDSVRFYVDVLGFEIMYERGTPDFGMLALGRVQLMLQQFDEDVWMTGELARPFGRGMNLEMEHDDPAAIERAVLAGGGSLYRSLATVTRDIGSGLTSTSQEVLVQDPDGYLLRFATP